MNAAKEGLMTKTGAALRIMAVDCCEHMRAELENVPTSQLIAVASKDEARISKQDKIDLIVIGIARYPVRRLYISQLRRVYPDVPVLILRREDVLPGELEECVRGEFILSSQDLGNDYKMVRALRKVLPLAPCAHVHKASNYDTVREVLRVIAEKYPHPELTLGQVAKALAISPKRLSHILNRQVGVSFRQLLRDMRIEEAKRMLNSYRYSVKEVAARVGFSDSHYFSRSFKELTGLSASEYRSHTAILS
jgi:AraC-like DNA-binding protein